MTAGRRGRMPPGRLLLWLTLLAVVLGVLYIQLPRLVVMRVAAPDTSEPGPGGARSGEATRAPTGRDDPATRQGSPSAGSYTYRVEATYPHDPDAFTQGLVYLDGLLYEGTGLYGESSLRKVELETGRVLQSIDLAPEFFGEGIVVWNDSVVQITWQNRTGFVYDLASFERRGEWTYDTEGWGLTHDGQSIIMSDGSATLYFRDPDTLAVTGEVTVTDDGEQVRRLNELEYIDGEVYANVWLTDTIAIINPESGIVRAWIDMTGLLPPEDDGPETDVLNGIAYDPEGKRLFVTGKKWPKLFQIRLVPSGGSARLFPLTLTVPR